MVDATVDMAIKEQDEALVKAAQTVSHWVIDVWEKAVSVGVFDDTRPVGGLTCERAAVVLDRLELIQIP